MMHDIGSVHCVLCSWVPRSGAEWTYGLAFPNECQLVEVAPNALYVREEMVGSAVTASMPTAGATARKPTIYFQLFTFTVFFPQRHTLPPPHPDQLPGPGDVPDGVLELGWWRNREVGGRNQEPATTSGGL